MTATSVRAARGVTILHLSDLHFAEPTTGGHRGHFWNSESDELKKPVHDQRGLMGSLVKDVVHQRVKPTVVVVSGDLLDQANPTGVPLALSFLVELSERLEIPRSQLVLVPGNHDVIRGKIGTAAYEYYDEISKGFYGAVRATTVGKLGHERVELFDYPQFGLQVLGFNSNELHDSGESDGAVGDAQREIAQELMASVQAARLRLAVMHHHLEQPAGQFSRPIGIMRDPLTMKVWLAQHRFLMAIHGHQHVDWQSSVALQDWRFEVVAAGSVGVGTYGRSTWRLPLSYQLLVLDSPTNGRRIRREYSEQRCQFGRAHSGAEGENPWEQPLAFGPPTACGTVPQNLTEFIPDFDRLIQVTLGDHRSRIDAFRTRILGGQEINLFELVEEIQAIYPRHQGRQRKLFASETKNLVTRLVVALEVTPSNAAAAQMAFSHGRVARAPVSTYLFVAILMAQGQGRNSVPIHFDESDGQAHGDHDITEDVSVFCPTKNDAVLQFERLLWRVLLKRKADSYVPTCNESLDECVSHRAVRDRLATCNQQCHRYQLYFELAGYNENKNRPYVVVKDRVARDWESVAEQMMDVSFICFGGPAGTSTPLNEEKLARKVRDFLRLVEGK